ncbi:MAG: DUF4124 domain-containing protein [Betaproteobacteria bacterium]
MIETKRRGSMGAATTDRRSQSRLAVPLAGAALLAAALLAAPGPARAQAYKWVDDHGVVHYTDKMPPEAIDKGNTQLNKEGVPVKKTEPALTPEQRRAREAEAARRQQEAKEQEVIARRDRALMSSYTTESEIDLAKNRTLATIESVVTSTQAYGDQLTKRKAELEAKRAAYADKAVPAALDRELEGINVEYARQTDLLALKKREAAAAVAKYDADKRRWRELVASNNAQAEAAAARGAATVTK